jgi:tetratricopeptide (TPR) repeat protein
MLAQASSQPGKARQELDRLSQMEPECLTVWFALAGAALEEARAASRRLSEIAPRSEWDRRLQAEAVAARYPALAQSLWPGSLRTGQDYPAGTIPASAEGTAAESPESLYRQAHAALRLSQDAYSRVSQSPQFSAYLHALRALAAEQEGDEAAAIHEYQEGLTENPGSAVLHAGLGHLYWQRMDLQAAEPELERARTLDPADPVTAFELGDVYQRLGQPQPALEALNEALRLDPQFLLARWSRAKVYLAIGDSERALQDLEAAAPADTTGDLQFQLARLYRKLGRTDLAALAEKRSEEQRKAVGSRR